MKRYLVVTNILGKEEVTMWLSKDVFTEEKEYFDTLDDAKAYAKLFEEYGSTFNTPKKDINKKDNWYNIDKNKEKFRYSTFNPNEYLWGYVICDVEECKVLTWGGLCMRHISKYMDQRQVKDILFRGEDEIPKDYVWDNGEYEGWLQYRWGDGKNALDYVEPEKPKKKKEDIDEYYDVDSNDIYIDDNEDIENSFLKEEDREKLKRLIDRW